MTTPLSPPRKLHVYMLLKQDKLSFYPTGSIVGTGLSTGFYMSKEDAEHQRMLEILKNEKVSDMYHVFELEVPNPAYRE